MTRRLPLFPALLFLGALLTPHAHADATADAKHSITAAYAQMDAATQQRDTDKMFASYDPDFVSITPDGKTHDVMDLRDAIEKIFGVIQKVKEKTLIQKIAVQGLTVTVTCTQHVSIYGDDPDTQKPLRFEDVSVSRDFWVNTEDGWRLKRSRTLTDHETMNGKPIQRKRRH